MSQPNHNKYSFDSLSKNFLVSTMDVETKRRFVEMIEAERKGREDIIYFSEEMLGVPLNDYQRKWLTRTTTPRSKWAEKFNEIIEDIGGFLLGSNISSIGNQSQPLGADILTPNGWKKMGEMMVGDFVMTQDGTATKVVGVYPQGKKDTYRVVFNDESSTICSLDHLWMVQDSGNRFRKDCPNRYGAWSVMSLQDILLRWGAEPSAKNRVAIPVVEPIQFPSQEVSYDPYLLGILIGDGGMTNDTVNLTTADKEIAQAFGTSLMKRGQRFAFGVRGAITVMKQLGLAGKYSYEKHIPKEYLWNDANTRLAVLQGLMDTDGSITGKCGVEYTTTSPQLCDDMKFLVQSFGGKVEVRTRKTTYPYKGESKIGRLSYRLRIKIHGVNPFRLKRKAEKFYDTLLTKNRVMIRIEKVDNEEMQCIKVEHPSHLYITNDFIVTHNSGKTVGIAIKHIWFNKYKIGMELDGTLINSAYYATLNISPHSRQTKACYQHIKDILGGQFIIDEEGKKRLNVLSPLMRDFIVGDNVNLGEIRFANKSVMYSVPTGQDQASSLAGAQFGYISYDECSQSLHLKEELGAKILSRLIKYGSCLDLIATPEVDSPSHQYYSHIVKLGMQKREGWWSLVGMGMDSNKFISKEQRERAKATLLATDKKRYRQVVFGEFITSGKRFFDTSEIENLWKLSGKKDCQKNGKYLLVADWGFSDSGDESVFMVLDYTNFHISNKIDVVNHESIQGGSPQMQFALLRTLYDQYTWYDDDGVTAHKPVFLTDAQGLGGVVIKKLLVLLQPRSFEIDKDEALFILKGAMSKGRDYIESEVDGAIIEKNPDYGSVRSYYIEELSEQAGNYHIDDKKLTTDFVMTLMMGVSWIIKKFGNAPSKKVNFNPLAGYEASILRPKGQDEYKQQRQYPTLIR